MDVSPEVRCLRMESGTVPGRLIRLPIGHIPGEPFQLARAGVPQGSGTVLGEIGPAAPVCRVWSGPVERQARKDDGSAGAAFDRSSRSPLPKCPLSSRVSSIQTWGSTLTVPVKITFQKVIGIRSQSWCRQARSRRSDRGHGRIRHRRCPDARRNLRRSPHP